MFDALKQSSFCLRVHDRHDLLQISDHQRTPWLHALNRNLAFAASAIALISGEA